MSDLDGVRLNVEFGYYEYGAARVSVEVVRQKYQRGMRIAGYPDKQQHKAIARDIARWLIANAETRPLRAH